LRRWFGSFCEAKDPTSPSSNYSPAAPVTFVATTTLTIGGVAGLTGDKGKVSSPICIGGEVKVTSPIFTTCERVALKF